MARASVRIARLFMAIALVIGLFPGIAHAAAHATAVEDGALEAASVDMAAAASDEPLSQSGLKSAPKPTLEQLRAAWAAVPAAPWGLDMFATINDAAAYRAATLSPDALVYAQAYVNFARYAAGVGPVVFTDGLNASAAQGALILAANGASPNIAPVTPTGVTDEQARLGKYAYDAGSAMWVMSMDENFEALEFLMKTICDGAPTDNARPFASRSRFFDPNTTTMGFGAAYGSLPDNSVFYGELREHNDPDSAFYSASYPAVSQSSAVSPEDYDFLAWPASGNFPSNVFSNQAYWSVALSPAKYAAVVRDNLQVTVTRLADGTSWTMTAADAGAGAHEQKSLIVSSDDSGADMRIIFGLGESAVDRPEYEGSWRVDITGLAAAGTGDPAALSYQVDFVDARIPIGDAKVTLDPSEVVADGGPYYPDITVTYEGKELVNGRDYASMGYEDNVEPGTGWVEIVGMGRFTSTTRGTFTIRENDNALASVALASGATTLTYNGMAQRPALRVLSKKGAVLKEGTDFIAEYANNENAGTATVSVTGINGYMGSATTTFTIAPAPISSAKVAPSSYSFVYDGVEKRPAITVKIGNVTVPSSNYSVTYKDNVNAGAASATVVGTGNLTGTTSVTYLVDGILSLYAGTTRFGTGAAIARAACALPGATYKGVIIVAGYGDRFPDALSATGLAGILNYPIVMTGDNTIPKETANALDAIKKSNGGVALDIVIVGSYGVVSKDVQKALTKWGKVSTRLGGKDRYETNQLVYAYGSRYKAWSSDYAFVATGSNYPDALAIAPYLAYAHAPIVLVDKNAQTLPASAKDAVANAEALVALGGEDAVSSKLMNAANKGKSSQWTRLGGATRLDTSALIFNWELKHGLTLEGSGVATAWNFPDALVSGFLLGKTGSALCLADSKGTSKDVLGAANVSALRSWAAIQCANRLCVFGSTGAVGTSVYNQASSAVGWKSFRKS